MFPFLLNNYLYNVGLFIYTNFDLKKVCKAYSISSCMKHCCYFHLQNVPGTYPSSLIMNQPKPQSTLFKAFSETPKSMWVPSTHSNSVVTTQASNMATMSCTSAGARISHQAEPMGKLCLNSLLFGVS